jgi:hypothetical protein
MALNELPDYPKTPAHITDAYTNQKAFSELTAEYPKTPAHVAETLDNHKAFNELPEYPKTPAHIADAYTNQKAFNELAAEYPKTPAHVEAVLANQTALNELPTEYPSTPAHIAATLPDSTNESPLERLSTPAPALPSQPSTPEAVETMVEKEASSPAQEFDSEDEPEDMSFELTGPLVEIQPEPESSIIEHDESIVHSEAAAPLTDEAATLLDDEPAAPIDDGNKPRATISASVMFAAPDVSLAAPASPGKRSALRSPVKANLKTPKKTVTWNDDEPESDFLMYGGPLRGMKFFVDVTSNGKDQNFLFTGLLEDMGAKVERTWDGTSVSHVLFKDGNLATLEKVLASKGAVKCVNLGWILDCDKNQTRMDETPYLVDLTSVKVPSPPKSRFGPYTPAKTPSKYAPALQAKPSSIPSTPTSSEFDRSTIIDDDKENSEIGIFFTPQINQVKTCPKPKSSWLNKSPMKTPSKENFLKQNPMKALSTGKKRAAPTPSFGGGLFEAPPKKLRFF